MRVPKQNLCFVFTHCLKLLDPTKDNWGLSAELWLLLLQMITMNVWHQCRDPSHAIWQDVLEGLCYHQQTRQLFFLIQTAVSQTYLA